MPPPAPRPLRSRTDEQLANYQKLCRQRLREDTDNRDRARRDLALLIKGATKHKIVVGTGLVGFVLGLATTAVFGPVGVGLAGVSTVLEIEGLGGLRCAIRDRVQLRNDIAEYDEGIEYWGKETVRVLDEWRRRRS